MTAARHLRVVPDSAPPTQPRPAVVPGKAVHARRRRLRAEWLRDRVYGQRLPFATVVFAEWLTRQRWDERAAGYVCSQEKAQRELGLGRMTVIRSKARLVACGALVEVQRGCRRQRFSVLRLVP